MKDIPLLDRYAQAQTHTHARALATLTFGDLRVRFVGFLCVTLRFHLAHPGNRSSRMTDPFLTLSCRDWFVCFRFLLQANFVFVSFYSFITDSERLPINRARTHRHTCSGGSDHCSLVLARFVSKVLEWRRTAKRRAPNVFALCYYFRSGFLHFLSRFLPLSVVSLAIPC